mgnify:CR=1 FL=1
MSAIDRVGGWPKVLAQLAGGQVEVAPPVDRHEPVAVLDDVAERDRADTKRGAVATCR